MQDEQDAEGVERRPPPPSEDQMAVPQGDREPEERAKPAGSIQPPPRRTKLERKRYGGVDRHRFAVTGALATAFTVVLVASALTAGTVLGSTLGPGIGGFVAEFGTVDADEGVIYPVLDEQPACANAPQLEASLRGNVEIDDYIAFYKDLPTPDGFPVDVIRINVVADDIPNAVDAQDLDLRFTGLRAEYAALGDPDSENMELREFGPDVWDEGNGSTDRFSQDRLFGLDDADYEFGIGAEGDEAFHIENGKATAHHLSAARLEVPDVDLFLSMGDEGDFEGDTGVVERPVEPSERDCESLAS